MRVMLLIAMSLAGWGPQSEADRLVAQLRDLPAPMPATISQNRPIPSEAKRRELYQQLRGLDAKALPALAAGLRSPDVRLRRNVLLAVEALSGTWWRLTPQDPPHPIDISPLLPDLIAAMKDKDQYVRGWSAQAIGNIGNAAAPAVPALMRMLASDDDGDRNSACIGLRRIGPAAKDALPALRRALADPSKDVRRFARLAIDSIARH